MACSNLRAVAASSGPVWTLKSAMMKNSAEGTVFQQGHHVLAFIGGDGKPDVRFIIFLEKVLAFTCSSIATWMTDLISSKRETTEEASCVSYSGMGAGKSCSCTLPS